MSDTSEQDARSLDDIEARLSGTEGLDIEAPEADAAEQRATLRDAEERTPTYIPFEVDEADASEQLRVVELDEDDYR
jgi:uncharacterized protein YbjT (DUF2867 family)